MVSGFLSETLLAKPLRTLYFFADFASLPPLTMVRRVLIDRRIRFLMSAWPSSFPACWWKRGLFPITLPPLRRRYMPSDCR